jgi:phosphotransferase system HPr-like phosphotransfer protein
VAYLFHKFSDTDRNICEKETYDLVKSLIHWRPYIHGANGGVTVYTDNIACTHLSTQKEVKGRKHINWMSVLADYGDQLQIKHVSGEQNRVADALSRVVSSFVSSEDR